MQITDPTLVRLGHWMAQCCASDLCKIEDQHDVAFAVGALHGDPACIPFEGVWENRAEALAALTSRGLGIDD